MGPIHHEPIIIVNATEFRCDAIIIEEQQIRNLPLKDLYWDAIEGKAARREFGNVETLEWLWDTVGSPVKDFLAFTAPPTGHVWPHVWWIATETLSYFPLHASGYNDRGSSETVIDRVMSSYGSSVKSIIHDRQRRQHQKISGSALIIDMEHTPGLRRLNYATTETSAVASIYKSMNLQPVMGMRERAHVVSRLKDCTVFHFAGHGHADPSDPLESYLCLEDGKQTPLRVADLLKMNWKTDHHSFSQHAEQARSGT